jgi:hypothetical protein
MRTNLEEEIEAEVEEIMKVAKETIIITVVKITISRRMIKEG